ncbi:AcrR family transcriptional regulator [Lipingzhangella halophila]|uniref:AcrR family transcriptional regulator n=1 Tax=Lipingzhangella halophila TaxID=1783352 RepID=A0A7W7RDV5_9ACTN|nr:TetR family transcriptional regulator [Lipingzhangella halophila]MBB4929621.1 AcrR family transcriptional regulator [Lipingzhangella halophila]
MKRSSEESKETILAAARERFATEGYDRATIRAIAAEANIDPAMVMRYFGNKEQLFAAAAEFDLRLPDLADVERERVGAVLAAHFLDRWEGDEALMILLRGGVTKEDVAERMRGIFANQLAPIVNRLSSDPSEAPTRAALVSTQILGLALCRYVLRVPPVVAMSREEVIAWFGPTLQYYLTGEAPVR